MHAPAASLTRAELTQFLHLSPDVVDALLSSGHLLCLIQNGEPRIPIEQLESFFRDTLVQIYRTEAILSEAVTESDVGTTLSRPEPEPEREPEPEPVKEPAPRPPEERRPAPSVPKPITVVEEEGNHVTELRNATRFIPRRQIDGIFNDVRFSIVQLSTSGLRIRHHEELIPGAEEKMSFALLRPPRSFVMRAKVVWTSIARYGATDETTFHISGLRITQHGERLTRAIDVLKSLHDLQPELRSTPLWVKDAEAAVVGLESITDDEMAMVMGAVQKFAADPYEANRWYGRAKFALAEEHVRRNAPQKKRDRDEVLGIWEYLERQVAIPKIAGVVSLIRNGRLAV